MFQMMVRVYMYIILRIVFSGADRLYGCTFVIIVHYRTVIMLGLRFAKAQIYLFGKFISNDRGTDLEMVGDVNLLSKLLLVLIITPKHVLNSQSQMNQLVPVGKTKYIKIHVQYTYIAIGNNLRI